MKKLALVLALLACPAFAQEPPIVVNGELLTPEPTPTPTPVDGYSFTAMAGGTVSMSSEAETKVAPIARIQVDGPLALGSADPSKLPRLHVTADLEALPGDTIDQAGGIASTFEQFKGLRFTVGISQRISKWLELGDQTVATSLYVDGGFATRLDGEPKARDRAPRFMSFGARFDEKNSGSFLKLGAGPDQRLDGSWQMVAHIEGYVRAHKFEGIGAEVGLLVRALLGVDISSPTRPSLTGGRRDSILVGFTGGK